MRLSLESPIEETTDVPVTVAASDGATRQVPPGFSGVEGACARRQGFLRELGRSGHFHGTPAVYRVAAANNTPAQRWRVGCRTGANLRRNRGTARAKENQARREEWPEVL